MTTRDPSPPPGSAFHERKDLVSYGAWAAVLAAVIGVTALVIDLINVRWGGVAEPRLSAIFTPALLVGLICGRASARTVAGRIAMHLSWAPFAVILIILAIVSTDQSASFLRAFGQTLIEMIRVAGEVVGTAVKGSD
ncbi:hypothetical protein [Paractinoplanes atraurantiacus]|uniref:Uncharacterized protein n=1 Tax=Paractinoplanes atraurantiacus TaxID=1036182 RepID=A0A285J027_9ACTN|nr:hypothetical protein [Actinoplanes atraurantiacus]SNY53568.1 hypothetical protein SAMN05421748_11465 [Actinoplanes atraurantiacus]